MATSSSDSAVLDCDGDCIQKEAVFRVFDHCPPPLLVDSHTWRPIHLLECSLRHLVNHGLRVVAVG